MYPALLLAVLSFLLVIIPANSQNSYGSLGRGLLNSGHLQTGGLIYPNTDGSGPQADSLAAAIYGVAVPPGFNQFSASENYYGQNREDAFSDSFGNGGIISDAIRPSDLLLGTGIHTGGGGRGGSYSTYISDFSSFGDFGSHSSNDQKSSSSSLIEIDPIAARFGVVIPNVGHAPLDPSLSGSTESFGEGTGTGVLEALLGIDKFNYELFDAERLIRFPQAGKENYFKRNSIVYSTLAGLADGTKDIFNLSPIETSIKFDLPTQATLPDTSLFSPHHNIDVNNIPPAVIGNQNALPRVDESFSGDEPAVTDNVSSPHVVNQEKNQADAITNAFKFSDDQIIKLEQLKRNFQHSNAFHIASGKFSSSLSTAHANKPKTPESDDNVELTSDQENHSQLPATITSKVKDVKQTASKEVTLTYAKSSSPYVYRGAHREQHKAKHSKKDTIAIDTPENIPVAESLTAMETNGESISNRKKESMVESSNSYNFLTAPGYRTHN